MKVLRENLICDRESVNLANIFMSISEDLRAFFDDFSMMESDHYATEHGIELDSRGWEFDWSHGMDVLLDDAVDFLDQEMSEEFKAAVKIERDPAELPKSGVDFNPDFLPVRVTIDPDRLLKLWGDREINDGKNISGFFRTADDRHWTTAKVLQELIWDELGDYGTENFVHYYWPDNLDLEDCATHPVIEDHYDTKDPGHFCKCEES